MQGGEDEALERLAKYMARGDWVRPTFLNFFLLFSRPHLKALSYLCTSRVSTLPGNTQGIYCILVAPSLLHIAPRYILDRKLQPQQMHLLDPEIQKQRANT